MKVLKWVAIVIGVLWVLSILGRGTTSSVHRVDDESANASVEEAMKEHETIQGMRVLGNLYTPKSANIRSAPSGTARIVRRTAPGEKLKFLDASGSFYRVVGSDTSATEWISEKVVITEDEHRRRASATLRVGSWNWGIQYDFAIAEGQITNVGYESLKNVSAQVTYYTASGGFITSDDALIEYDPLLPGQTSPWKVITRGNPAMARATVEFKTLRGRTLASYRE